MSNKIYQMVTDQIIKQLESVDSSDYSTPWFCIGHSPVNIRGTAYRGINHILLSHSGFASNIWATFKQWKEKECQIKKGERSQIVVLWKFFNEADENGEATGKTAGVMTRYYRVFNSEQVDGDFAREIEQTFKDKLKNHNPIAQAQVFVDGYTSNERLPVRNSDRAYYASGIRDHIAMPELGQFRSAEHYYCGFPGGWDILAHDETRRASSYLLKMAHQSQFGSVFGTSKPVGPAPAQIGRQLLTRPAQGG